MLTQHTHTHTHTHSLSLSLCFVCRTWHAKSYISTHQGRGSIWAKVSQTEESGLHELSLRKLDLELVPNQLLYCKFLRKLRLSHNSLRHFPVLLLELPNLLHLDLAHNLITDIPTEITQLKHLQILDLTNNRIAALPSAQVCIVSLSLSLSVCVSYIAV
jgi:Leucine-rich repeat (LRR) protein